MDKLLLENGDKLLKEDGYFLLLNVRILIILSAVTNISAKYIRTVSKKIESISSQTIILETKRILLITLISATNTIVKIIKESTKILSVISQTNQNIIKSVLKNLYSYGIINTNIKKSITKNIKAISTQNIEIIRIRTLKMLIEAQTSVTTVMIVMRKVFLTSLSNTTIKIARDVTKLLKVRLNAITTIRHPFWRLKYPPHGDSEEYNVKYSKHGDEEDYNLKYKNHD